MWILPTMNRAVRCQEAIDTMIDCGIATPGIVVVNGPQQNDEYRRLRLPHDWTMEFLPENVGLCASLNQQFAKHLNEEWYGFICDDEHVLTPGFDKTIIEAAGSWNIAHGNDGWRSSYRLWTYVVFGGELLRTVGYWGLPGLWHCEFETHWELIAAEFGLTRWCESVTTKHQHVEIGAAPDDETYQAGRAKRWQDLAAFNHWKSTEWHRLKAKLAQIIPSDH